MGKESDTQGLGINYLIKSRRLGHPMPKCSYIVMTARTEWCIPLYSPLGLLNLLMCLMP